MPKLTVTFQYEASVEVDVSDAELAVLRRRHPQTDMDADCLTDTRKQVLSRAYEKEKELDARGSADLMDTTVYQDGWTDEEVSALLRATVDEIREDQQG